MPSISGRRSGPSRDGPGVTQLWRRGGRRERKYFEELETGGKAVTKRDWEGKTERRRAEEGCRVWSTGCADLVDLLSVRCGSFFSEKRGYLLWTCSYCSVFCELLVWSFRRKRKCQCRKALNCDERRVLKANGESVYGVMRKDP